MSHQSSFLNITPGWVRKVINTAFGQQTLVAHGDLGQFDDITDEAGAGAPTFSNGIETDVITEETATIGITMSSDVKIAAGKVLSVGVLTTTQRDALTPVNGMFLYNSTLDKFQGREGGAWVTFTTA